MRASGPAARLGTAVLQCIITIEGHGFVDVEDVELLRLPDEGDPIETKYGTAIVTGTEAVPPGGRYEGRISCRLP